MWKRKTGIDHEFGVMEFPTILFFKSGEVIDHVTGLTPKNVMITKIENALTSTNSTKLLYKSLKPTTMSEEMKYFYLKNHPMLASLSEQKLMAAAAMAKMKTVYRGEIISYGETGYTRIHFLVKGKVKITDTSSNARTELVKDILTEPDIFGDLGLEGHLINR